MNREKSHKFDMKVYSVLYIFISLNSFRFFYIQNAVKINRTCIIDAKFLQIITTFKEQHIGFLFSIIPPLSLSPSNYIFTSLAFFFHSPLLHSALFLFRYFGLLSEINAGVVQPKAAVDTQSHFTILTGLSVCLCYPVCTPYQFLAELLMEF